MNQPQFVPRQADPTTEKTRHELERALSLTRRTMARQDLLKRLWRLENEARRGAGINDHR